MIGTSFFSDMDRLFTIPASRFLPLLLIFICVSYSNSIYSTATVLDDSASFIEVANVYVEDFSGESLAKLSETRFGKRRYIPMLTFAVDNSLAKWLIAETGQYSSERHKLRLKIAHISNIIVHLLTTLVLFLFLKALLQTKVARGSGGDLLVSSSGFALIVCALWALNPVQTNVVTYLVQRMAGLAAFFYLTSLLLYVCARQRSSRWQRLICWSGCVVAAAAAFSSKENTATLPFAMLLVEFIFISPELGAKCYTFWRRRKGLNIFWLLLALGIILPLAYHLFSQYTGGYGHRHFNMAERLYTELRIVVFYLSLLLLPLPGRLNLDHDFPLSHGLLTPPETMLSLLLLAGLMVVAFRLKKRFPLIAFGIFWFFLNLVIESSFISLELVFEHRLYLPAIGFYVAFVAIIIQLCSGLRGMDPGETKKIVFLLIVGASAVFSVLTTYRNNDWRDNYSIYLDSNEKSPAKPRTYVNLGSALGRMGRYQEAIEVLEKAVNLGRKGYEGDVTAINNILICYMNLDKAEEAVARGEAFLERMTPSMNKTYFHKFMYNLGRSYYLVGRYSDALEAFVTGLQYKWPNEYMLLPGAIEKVLLDASGSDEGKRQLGLTGEALEVPLLMAEIMRRVRRYEFGQYYLDKAAMIDEENELLQRYSQQFQKEIDLNNRAASLADPENDLIYKRSWRFRLLLKLAFFIEDYYPPLQGKPLKMLYEQARVVGPESPFADLRLALWYTGRGRCREAVAVLEQTLNNQPDFVPAFEILGRCYMEMEDYDASARAFLKLLSLNPGHHRWSAIEKFFRLVPGEILLKQEQ